MSGEEAAAPALEAQRRGERAHAPARAAADSAPATPWSQAAGVFLATLAGLQGGAPEAWSKVFETPAAPDFAGERVALALDGAADGLLTIPPQDDKPDHAHGMLTITAGAGRRTRFVVRDAQRDDPATADALWLHLAVSAEMGGFEEPRVALRAFQGSSDEFAVARIRSDGVALLGQLPLSLAPQKPFVLSIGVVAGSAIAYVDGLPRHRGPIVLPSASGFVFDVHSTTDRPGRVQVLAAALQRGGSRPYWVAAPDEAALADVVRSAAIAGPPSGLWRALEGASNFPGLGGIDVADALVRNEEARPTVPELSALLAAAAAGASERPEAGAREPIVDVSDISVSLSANPAGHALWRRDMEGRKVSKVVDGLSMRAYEGDIVGILGRNGAGKSTLLKALVGAMPLSEGRIEIHGRAVLLRPGAGLHPNLTGRENIMKSGLYMNLEPRRIREMTPAIAAFAELEEHLDRPFKYYSDGMRSRLIFAIATAMPYDILLLDELLSAGDLGFQQKVAKRLDSVIERAKVLLVVQHTFDFVIARCTRCLVMDGGRAAFFGEPKMGAEVYREILSR